MPDSLDDTIHHFGILYDAIIVARLAEEQGPHAGAFNTALFEVGASVLVTPFLAPARLGRHVALVWTRTPQSARAMRSAVALLQRADEVHVLTNSANDLAAPGEALDYLAVQGVWANALSFDGTSLTARGRGRAIIEAVRGVGAGFMVMGPSASSARTLCSVSAAPRANWSPLRRSLCCCRVDRLSPRYVASNSASAMPLSPATTYSSHRRPLASKMQGSRSWWTGSSTAPRAEGTRGRSAPSQS